MALKSMTAYGKGSQTFSAGRIDVEIQSVNRKHLEMQVYLPSFLQKFDAEVRKWVAAQIGRGYVSVKVTIVPNETSPFAITPNRALAKQLKAAWHQLADDLKIQLDDASLVQILLQQENLMVYSEEGTSLEIYRSALQSVVQEAIQGCMGMKVQEGSALQADMQGRLEAARASVKEIEARAAGASDRYRQKLLQRLQEILQAALTEDERVLREVALFAEKVDITEEITRLKSHLEQAVEVLKAGKEGTGKTMEFILQEMNREVNTIGSKCQDVEISRSVIDLKSELERIREQIQNVE